MAIPATAVSFTESLGTAEIKKWRAQGSLSLAIGVTILPDSWTLVLFPEAVAMGLEIIVDDLTYPDPALDVTGTSIDFWMRVDPEFEDAVTFLGTGVPGPIELTFFTSEVPPSKIQCTIVVTVAQKGSG